MDKRRNRQESGAVEVEATFILPIAILCVMLLLYLSLFLFQRANLQACLETALLYYKNTITDTYVTRNDEMEYVLSGDSYIGTANSYAATEPLNPYRWMDSDNNSVSNFETYFKSVAGKMLFDDNVELSLNYRNFVLLREFEVTAKQTVSSPIDFSMIGAGNEYVISATARMVAVDHDDTIRNVDYVIDILEDTVVGDFIRNIGTTVANCYEKLKSVLHVS